MELTNWHLTCIRVLDPKIRAFPLVTEEGAEADARASEARQMPGDLIGPLGTPIAHKDIYNSATQEFATGGHSFDVLWPLGASVPSFEDGSDRTERAEVAVICPCAHCKSK